MKEELKEKDHILCKKFPEAGICCNCSGCSGHPISEEEEVVYNEHLKKIRI